MAVASYMDFFGYEFDGTPDEGVVRVKYRVRYNAPIVTATVSYTVNGDNANFRVDDLGRRHRSSKAEQERIYEILRVAANYRRMYANTGEASREFPRR